MTRLGMGGFGTGLIALALGCRSPTPPPPGPAALATFPWDSVVALARGSHVTWRMWRGDPAINAYIDQWVAPRLQSRYGITLTAVPGLGAEIVNQLVVERETGAPGSTDLLWINGATFHQLRAESLLAGPWAGALPNGRFVDSTSPIIARDFEQDPAGYESPWGRVQFTLIYDTVRTPHPPQTVAALGEWIRTHPGRFTHDQEFTGTTFLTTLMYALGGGAKHFQGRFDPVRYAAGSAAVFDWLGSHRGAFWRRGTTYPLGVADLHRLFANGEVDFTMSANENEVIGKIRDGILPPSARPLLLRDGTIATAHYVGIPFNAPSPAAAMVVADFLLSPEAQFEKGNTDGWGDGSVLALNRLPPGWGDRWVSRARDPRALDPAALARLARPEVDPAYHAHLEADWRDRLRRGAE